MRAPSPFLFFRWRLNIKFLFTQSMADKAKLNWLKRFFRRSAPKAEPPVVFREFRRTVRSYLEVPIVVEAERGSYDATTFDISDQGLFVRTAQLPIPGVSMKTRFSLPNEDRKAIHEAIKLNLI